MVKGKYSIIWDDVAKTELREAYNYIKKNSTANALSVRNNILKSVRELEKIHLYMNQIVSGKIMTDLIWHLKKMDIE